MHSLWLSGAFSPAFSPDELLLSFFPDCTFYTNSFGSKPGIKAGEWGGSKGNLSSLYWSFFTLNSLPSLLTVVYFSDSLSS